jgi:hypothetical protein
VNTYKPARLNFLPMLLRYSQMREKAQHDKQCLSLHTEGLTVLFHFHAVWHWNCVYKTREFPRLFSIWEATLYNF